MYCLRNSRRYGGKKSLVRCVYHLSYMCDGRLVVMIQLKRINVYCILKKRVAQPDQSC